MSEWASKNVVGITCPIDQTGWSKKVLFLNEYSNVFHQNPQSEILKVCMVADSGFFENFLYQDGVKSTVSWVFEDLKFKITEGY